MTPEQEAIVIRLLDRLVTASEETYKLVPSFMSAKLVKIRKVLDEASDLLKRLKGIG